MVNEKRMRLVQKAMVGFFCVFAGCLAGAMVLAVVALAKLVL